jgi:hypothetical protein
MQVHTDVVFPQKNMCPDVRVTSASRTSIYLPNTHMLYTIVVEGKFLYGHHAAHGWSLSQTHQEID